MGSVLITPATLGMGILHASTSFSPPKHTTVPASSSSAVSYFSAKSAYCANVAVPWNVTAYTSLYLNGPLPKSTALSELV